MKLGITKAGAAHGIHRVHGALHLSYFAGVLIEGHGFYSYAAGALFLVTILGGLLGDKEAE